MADVILPLIYYFAAIGRTIDLRTYDLGRQSIYEEADTVETQVNALNSTYYVLPNKMFSASSLNIPIDFLIGVKRKRYYDDMIYVPTVDFKANFDSAIIIFIAEYRTTDQTVKENATPISNWPETQNIEESHTHYIDTMHYGSRCTGVITFQSSVKGDVQILRRILRDVMGSSGHIGENTADLYMKALEAMEVSKDVRGNVYMSGMKVKATNTDLPTDVYFNTATLLERLGEFSKYVKPRNPERNEAPLFVTLKPLHDLDNRYASLEKNEKTERYLLKLYEMSNDLDYTYGEASYFSMRIPYGEVEKEKKFGAFLEKLRSVRDDVRSLMFSGVSIYEDLDFSAFNSTFEKYELGLDNSTENYFTLYSIIEDEMGVTCENDFLEPTRGSLIAEENQIVWKGKLLGGLAQCKDFCVNDERCRAVGYESKKKECMLFYRSTNSARILFPEDNHCDMNVYDRKCKKNL